MREVHIDLDVPEPTDEASPRPVPRRYVIAAVLALFAGVAGIGLVNRPPDPLPTATLVDAPPVWTTDFPAELGEPYTADLTADVVLVTAQRGLIAYDRHGGGELWRLGLAAISESPSGITLDPRTAGLATIVGDAVVVDRQRVTATDRPEHLVFDLADGESRFSVEPGPAWPRSAFEVHLTPTALVTNDCDDDGCRLTAHELDDGEERWRRDVPGDHQTWWPSARAGWEHHELGTPFEPDEITPDPDADFFLLTEYDPDAAPDRPSMVESVGFADGETLGWWETDSADTLAYRLLGGHLLAATPARLRSIDPATGAELWNTDSFGDHAFGESATRLLVGGKILDSAADGSRTRLIDLADGTPGPTLTAEHPLVVDSGVAVTNDGRTIRGHDLATAGELWGTTLRESPWGHFSDRAVWADAGWMVLDGHLRDELDAPPWIMALNLTTGHVRGIGGGRVLGYGEGEMLMTGAGRELRLVKLG